MKSDEITNKINLGQLISVAKPKSLKKTKVVGFLMILSALSNLAIDIFNGNGINYQHYSEAILTGIGLITLRSAIEKIQ